MTSSGQVFLKPGTYSTQNVIQQYIQKWWDTFLSATEMCSPSDSSGSPAVGTMKDELRKMAWSQGHPDYMGTDKFENIQAKLDSIIKK